MLSANVGFDLVAASVLCDLGSELCLVVLSLTPKVSLGFGLCEALCLGYVVMLAGASRLEMGIPTSPKGHFVVSVSCWVTKLKCSA